jgi:hypothetical protein
MASENAVKAAVKATEVVETVENVVAKAPTLTKGRVVGLLVGAAVVGTAAGVVYGIKRLKKAEKSVEDETATVSE